MAPYPAGYPSLPPLRYTTDTTLEENKLPSRWYTLAFNQPNKETMRLTTIAKRLLDGDTKKLVKAGLLTRELELTESGRAELWAILFEANKDELVKAADKVLEQRKQ